VQSRRQFSSQLVRKDPGAEGAGAHQRATVLHLPVRGDLGEQGVSQVLASRIAVFGVRRPAVEVLDDAVRGERLGGTDRVEDRKSEPGVEDGHSGFGLPSGVDRHQVRQVAVDLLPGVAAA
jgi:hypothetical protein